MFSIFKKAKYKYLSFFLLISLFTLGIFSLTQSTSSSMSKEEGVFNPKIDWFFLKTSNDITVSMGKRSSNLPTIRYEKDTDHLQFSMYGIAYSNRQPFLIGKQSVSDYNLTPISSTTAVSLETNVKTPNEPVLFYRSVDKDIDVVYKITNIPLKVKEEIVLNNIVGISELDSNLHMDPNTHNLTPKTQNLPPTSFLFSAETTAKPAKQQDGSINFYDKEGDYLFQLDKPFMIDAKGNRSEDVSLEIEPVKHRVSDAIKSFLNFQLSTFNPQFIFNNFIIKNLLSPKNLHRMSILGPRQYIITLSADSAWLSTAAYPVIIDPTITHNADSNFSGQMNRVADNDSTTSTQLESSYGENANDPYTVLNLHFNEANGSTNIKDYASTTRVITAYNNASTTNYVTQLGTGNSAAFDGAGDSLSVPDSDDLSFGSSDFSVDLWVRFNALGDGTLFGRGNPGASKQVVLNYVNSQGVIYFNYSTDGTNWKNQLQYPWSPSVNIWYHLALVRRGPVARVFVNGVQLTASVDYSLGTDSVFNSTSPWGIGADPTYDGSYTNGYIDDFRIIKGRALTPEEIKAAASRRPYAVYTSSVLDASASVAWNTINWTEGGVNTGDGEQPYNTNSLVAQWNFNDTSGTTLTASSSGSCTTSCNGALTNFAYTASQDQATTTTGWTANNKRWGAGALMMDGTNDYVSVADNSNWAFGNNDFTIEFWMNPSNNSGERFVISQGDPDLYTTSSWMVKHVNNILNFQATEGSSWFILMAASASSTIGNWHHVVITRSGSNAYIYQDGIQVASDTSASGSVRDDSNVLSLGSRSTIPDKFFSGILDSVRIYNGRALSAAEILSNYNAGNIEIQTRTGATSDPNDGTWEAWKPTTAETQLLSMDSDQSNWNAPQQIDGYTKLLLHTDGADAATSFPNSATTTHTVTANGNAQVDTAQSKFGGGSYLGDGNSDYLSSADSADWNLNTDISWTVDFWLNKNGTQSEYAVIVAQVNHVAAYNGWDISFGGVGNGNAGKIGYFGNGGAALSTSNTIADGWHHYAFVHNDSSDTLKIYVDGKEDNSRTASTVTITNVSRPLEIGARENFLTTRSFNGWLDELRVSKGIARWTSNFTPPPRAYGSNVKAENETTIKQEGTASGKLTLGAPQIDGNTVALWHFEETGTTTGTYLYDETANNNDATTTGTTVVDGIFGKARKFNGTSDVVTVEPSSSAGGGTDKASFDLWFYPTNISDVTQMLFSSGIDMQMDWTSNDGMTCFFYAGGAWGNIARYAASNVSLNQWHHAACVYDGSNAYIYVDGTLRNSVTKTGNLPARTLYYIGHYGPTYSFYGKIDEVKVSNRALSADEIAETYRMGANHHLTRQVSAVDLSAQTKLAFWIAADRPGTGLETMIGESDYANYELASSTLALSTTTVLYIKGDEIASSTSIKDSSFSGKTITANGNARTSGGGKIGNSVYFDGTGDYLSIPDSDDWNFGSGDFSIDFWLYPTAVDTRYLLMQRAGAGNDTVGIYIAIDGSGLFAITAYSGTASYGYGSYGALAAIPNQWQHLALVRNGGTITAYFNGYTLSPGAANPNIGTNSVNNPNIPLEIGRDNFWASANLSGNLDELRISKGAALTADQIRQAYEYGLRSHPITIDFGATLQPSNLISSATDYNFSLTATTSGLSATTSGLYLGDKIIIKENLGGTEYSAQGTVNAINTSTGAITVPSWDSGSTFPSGNGYSPNATVFKWQREYFDITGAATTTRNAITNLTLRPTNGAGGRTVYLDDFRYNTNYLTASSSSSVTSSNGRYMQYRAVFSSWDSFVSPFLSAISAVYTSTANMFAPGVGISGDGFLMF